MAALEIWHNGTKSQRNFIPSVLVVMDWFSKGCRFIPFCSLPSVLHIVEALFQHIFHWFGLPKYVSTPLVCVLYFSQLSPHFSVLSPTCYVVSQL